MHVLQPKHTKLKQNEVAELIEKYNISLTQLPKIKLTDPAVPADCKTGDILKIERKDDGKVYVFYRVVI